MSIQIETVWSVADAVAKRADQDARYVFGDLGLFLERPLKRWEYFCTPLNSLTFASTGGDGVHFGFLQIGDSSVQPIVMTVPMSDHHNTVVAEDLEEFLNLGYYAGWFLLEQLAYAPQRAVEYFKASDRGVSPDEQGLLNQVRSALHLQHVPLRLERLNQLESKYHHFVSAKEHPTAEDGAI